MKKQMVINSLNKNFESIKKIDENGVEYWEARELMLSLGYDRWENFENIIKKAKIACFSAKQKAENHFREVRKMVEVGSNTVREIKDWKLDRYACYLIAQNGDPKKPEIAMAQTYFAIQTRKQEIFEQLSDADKRLMIRGEVSAHNKELFKTAKNAGVSNFGSFNDAGYKGLYKMSLTEIENKKGIKKGDLLDRAGSTELAANLFRITQTDEKIKKDNIKGENNATQAHFVIGGKVRQAIKDIGGTMPENLPVERHIKELKKEQKKLQGKTRKIK
jgi:DNA-damage-inducible protein D